MQTSDPMYVAFTLLYTVQPIINIYMKGMLTLYNETPW